MIGPNQFGYEVQHQRRFEFAGMLIVGVCADGVGGVDLIQTVHRLERWPRGRHKQSLEMELKPVFRDDHEVAHPVVVPSTQQLVHRPMKGFRCQSRATPEGIPTYGYAEGERWDTQDDEAFGDLPGHSLGNDQIPPQREVWTILLQGAYREGDSPIRCEDPADFRPWQLGDRL
ncbi:MAG: hypothetical protein OSA81_02715 [Longimicrobiales bacterium]|nr:hypothetical protein [Longimicrobiales bacterium]